jgi:hypothetical protein
MISYLIIHSCLNLSLGRACRRLDVADAETIRNAPPGIKGNVQ